MAPKSLPYHRMTAAITSWFRLPEQGMRHYEMLCRGTTFGVKHKSSVYFLTCSHVAAPWRWPKLYPASWLQYVREENTQCIMHITKDGHIVDLLPMEKTVVHHNSLDACVLRLEDESHALAKMEDHGFAMEFVELSEEFPTPGQPVVCAGYAVDEKANNKKKKEEEEEELEFTGLDEEDAIVDLSPGGLELDLRTDKAPRKLNVSLGHINSFREGRSRGFAHMDQILPDGICGAPLVESATAGTTTTAGRCLGLIEGIVPPLDGTVRRPPSSNEKEEEVRQAIQGNAAFVYSQHLRELLKQVVKVD